MKLEKSKSSVEVTLSITDLSEDSLTEFRPFIRFDPLFTIEFIEFWELSVSLLEETILLTTEFNTCFSVADAIDDLTWLSVCELILFVTGFASS